jgi:two-component system chemotaxis sensor kinase CheA
MTDRFQQAFHEEARELLGELEAALLELDQNRNDPENIGRAFRALHTIKGSGAMFGFDDLAAFAHQLETAFDRVRNGQLAVGAPLINLTLAAGDQMKAMLEAASGGAAADSANCARILANLQDWMGPAEAPGVANPALGAGLTPPAPGPLTAWHIHFRPGPEVILHGTNPLLLFSELREMGELRVKADAGALPALSEIDAERCYVAWDLVLQTGAAVETIRDVFIFVEDECELKIERLSDSDPEAPAAPVEDPKPGAQPTARAVNRGAGSGIRVAAEKLDRLVNLVGELVSVQARLSEISVRRGDPEILAVSEQVDRLTAELRENSMSVRMLPLRGTFERFRRLVRDLSIELHKEVDLALEGADTELDKTVIDQLNDPLVHLIRNSMDHGVETPDARRAAGKPPTATVRLSAQYAGTQVLIRVSDDGRGLDPRAIRARAVERGLIDGSAQLSDAELFSLILAPGFSTAARVTDVSGRGIGMDVVRRSAEALRGSLELSSRPGAGLTVTLRLPLTLAIIDGLLVRVGPSYFVLPLANSLECVALSRQDIREAHGNHLACVRGETIPYIRLSECFGMAVAQPEREQIMVVEVDDGHYGLVVVEVLGNHQTVIKNLGRLYRDVSVISGATILGNGTVALILDPHRLVEHAIHSTAVKRRSALHALTQKEKNPCYVQ